MKRYAILFFALAMILSSCASTKKFVYLQDMEVGQKYAIEQLNQAVIHTGDRLSIVVTCKKPELAIPFNTITGSVSVEDNLFADASQSTAKSGYLVDSDGTIIFPIFGRLHLEGLTLKQASDMIKTMIIEGEYINDPSVTIEFINFKYVVWGASGNGVYTANGDRITIIEALAQAGDVSVNGRVDNVMVMREINGNREIYKMDLRSKDMFDSPGFYLQQNDVVYVEPKYRANVNSQRGWQIFTSSLSVLSTISTFVLLMMNLGMAN